MFEDLWQDSVAKLNDELLLASVAERKADDGTPVEGAVSARAASGWRANLTVLASH